MTFDRSCFEVQSFHPAVQDGCYGVSVLWLTLESHVVVPAFY